MIRFWMISFVRVYALALNNSFRSFFTFYYIPISLAKSKSRSKIIYWVIVKMFSFPEDINTLNTKAAEHRDGLCKWKSKSEALFLIQICHRYSSQSPSCNQKDEKSVCDGDLSEENLSRVYVAWSIQTPKCQFY